MKSDTQLVGAAGEHLVLSRLLARGILAAQAPRGTRKADILVNHLDGKAPCLIQVKTRSGKGADGGWHMKAKHEKLKNPRLWFVFVDMEPAEPICYVMPSSVVAEIVHLSHSIWLGLPGVNGRPHVDSDIRRIRPKYQFEIPGFPDGWMDQYRERWDLLLS